MPKFNRKGMQEHDYGFGAQFLDEISSQSSAFGSEGNRIANAKNIMDLVSLSLHPTDTVLLIVRGSDEREAEAGNIVLWTCNP